MKSVLIPAFLFFAVAVSKANVVSRPDSTLNLLDKGLIMNKLIQVKDKIDLRDYRGALQMCREILTEDKNNATAHYRMAECYLEIFEYDLGLDAYSKAIAADPGVNKDADYLFAKLAHRAGKLEQALEAVTRYKATLNEKEIKQYEVDLNEQQIKTAMELVKKPVNAKPVEMGENINSHQDDYSPMLSPDGKTFYLCSRRPSSTGSNLAGDYKYFEDIYTSTVDENGSWQKAEPLDGKVNTDEFDNCNYISKDGTIMYVTYNVDKFTKSSDIAIAKMSKSGKWNLGKPIKSKEVNTTYFDACPTLPDAMDQMVFISDRLGGSATGTSDLWKITMNNGAAIGVPVNLSSLNTVYNETTPCLTGDGLYMFFSSEGHGSMGGYDIFITKFVEGNWSTPVNLGYPINSVDDDTHFKLSPDGKKGYFSSIRRDGTGARDIYEVDLTSYDVFSLVK
ncbi:MAG TPA: tetratricopeptide repeat protein [Flavobacteriales bacterium]|nr:tetratricopeptide repeat protein [Flavobacteriales bacterium]